MQGRLSMSSFTLAHPLAQLAERRQCLTAARTPVAVRMPSPCNLENVGLLSVHIGLGV